jgi:hypothetical protein
MNFWKMAERAQKLYWLNKYRYCCRSEINIYIGYPVFSVEAVSAK